MEIRKNGHVGKISRIVLPSGIAGPRGLKVEAAESLSLGPALLCIGSTFRQASHGGIDGYQEL